MGGGVQASSAKVVKGEGSADARSRAWLAHAGLRPTRQRLALAGLLVGDGLDRHVTAEGLFEAAGRAQISVSLATIYNTLRSFTEAGLLAEITVDGARSYFDTRTDQHAHFYWEDSGEITDAPRDAVAFSAMPEAPGNAEIARVDVIIRLRHKD